MAKVRGCDFPDALFYNIEDNVWVRQESDGLITIGMTSYGCSLAGQIVAFTSKNVGRAINQGRSVSTVESGKWVGPVKAPVSGVIVAVNDVLLTEPEIINVDPYGDGWLAVLQPSDWSSECSALLVGDAMLSAIEDRMEAEGFDGC